LRKPPPDIPDLDVLEEKIAYRFRDRKLLIEALTHRSFHHENPKKAPAHNERLEFLGDSVLGLAVVEHLFLLKGGLSESTMSKVRSYVVKGSVLSEVAEGIGLGDYLLIGKGEEETGGRGKPSILSNALEALIGAIYIDGGFQSARGLVQGLFGETFLSVVGSGEFHDYKTELQEASQMGFGLLPEYRLSAQKGKEHRRMFHYDVFIAGELYGQGEGRSKKEAQAAAADEALRTLAEKRKTGGGLGP
jgi:ribonuclease-3